VTTIRKAIQHGRELLTSKAYNPQQEASLLLAHAIDKSKEFLITHSNEQLSDTSLQLYQNYLSRRIEGEPIAYIQQQKEFWSLPLKVSPGILIPRPETELIIEIALELLTDKDCPNILDLGTGSGCIALALAKEKPRATITACDNSSTCIDIAKTNAENLAIDNINFITSNWFESLEINNFDMVISNPPYISRNDEDIEDEVLKYEPESALFSRHKGLEDLFHIIEHAPNYLSSRGTLIVEHGYKQGNDVRTQFTKCSYNNIHTSQDMQQHERVTQGTMVK
jgi:release factor glutamine methyltransferase